MTVPRTVRGTTINSRTSRHTTKEASDLRPPVFLRINSKVGKKTTVRTVAQIRLLRKGRNTRYRRYPSARNQASRTKLANLDLRLKPRTVVMNSHPRCLRPVCAAVLEGGNAVVLSLDRQTGSTGHRWQSGFLALQMCR